MASGNAPVHHSPAGGRCPAGDPPNLDNSIPVPGFWDQASIEMPNYVTSALWYRTTVNLPGSSPLRAMRPYALGKAYYGRYIYVNGQYVGDYQYNYTSSNTDITPYLHAGENEIVIMLRELHPAKGRSQLPGACRYRRRTQFLLFWNHRQRDAGSQMIRRSLHCKPRPIWEMAPSRPAPHWKTHRIPM